MKEFWNKHSENCSIEEMMLDSNAEKISDQELPEILSVLPDYSNKKVLELGAGIG
jgi:phosphoethanolamine N-methyltransferase